MTPLQQFYHDYEEKMKRAVEVLKRELSELRGGRASPNLLEHVTVDYYGSATPLKQLAAITAPEPRLLVIQPWDAKLVTEIEKAIQKAKLGVSPLVDGKIVRLPIPSLTGERRAELIKLAAKMAEEGRISIRTIRRDANETVKKLKATNRATEDDVTESQTHVQKLTDKYIEQIQGILKAKEQELNTA